MNGNNVNIKGNSKVDYSNDELANLSLSQKAANDSLPKMYCLFSKYSRHKSSSHIKFDPTAFRKNKEMFSELVENAGCMEKYSQITKFNSISVAHL